MQPYDLLEHLRRRPFQPFRLTLTDGRTHEVRHPELVMVGRSTVTIGLPRAGDPRPVPVFDDLVTIPLVDVMGVAPAESTPAPSA
jgi:hypothetical protein